MRASLLASATAVSLNLYLTVLRSSSALAHRRKASLWPLRWPSVRAGPDDQELAQIAVAHLGDAPEPRLAAGRALARRQAEEGGELAPDAKAPMSWIVATIAEAVIGPTPGMVVSRLRRLVGLDRRRKLLVDRHDRLVERVDLIDERRKRPAHAVGDHDLAVLVEAVGGQPLQRIGVLRPLRRDHADLGHVSAQGVEQRRALARQQFARAVAHQLRLVVDRAQPARTVAPAAPPPRRSPPHRPRRSCSAAHRASHAPAGSASPRGRARRAARPQWCAEPHASIATKHGGN